MRGTITKRKLLATKDGKPIEQYYLVYDAGLKWNEKKGQYVRRQKWEKAKPNTRKAAEKQLARRLNEVESGEFIEPSRMLFSEFKDRWLKNYAQGQVKPGTVEDYKGYFKNHLVPAFGDRPLSAISVEDVQGFKAGKLADGYAPQTVKHLLRLFRQMLSHAEDWGYIRRNPAKKVQDPRVPHKEMDFLNPEEARAFLAAVPAKWYPLFLTALSTGLRIGELLAMRWANLDWKSSRYFVRETLSRARYDYKGGFTTPKTEGSAQSVDLTPTCLEILRQHHKRQAEEKLKIGPGYQDQDLIFATWKGTALEQKNIIHRQFNAALEDAGLRQIRFHDLRHTCATLLINEGISPKYIQRQLRHASIDTTFDRYGHLFPETNQEAAEKLDAVLMGDGQPVSPLPSNEYLTSGAKTG